MPQAKQTRPLASFDARSVLLFAAFTLGGSLAQAQTQTQQASPPQAVSPFAGFAPPAAPSGNTAPAGAAGIQGAAQDNPFQKALAAQGQPSGSARSAPLPAAHSNTADSVFDRADTNRDGQLSAAEAGQVSGLSSRFKQLDKDGNGTLSRTEFAPYSRP